MRHLFAAGMWLALAVGGGWAAWDWWSYADHQPFVSPLPADQGLTVRHDGRGGGHFLAHRNGGRRHTGVDLVAPRGTPVYAVKGGRAEVGHHRGYGRYVRLHHSKRLTTLYAHLSQVVVTQGQRVRQGELLGVTGKTGNARYRGITPHLHFEVRQAGRPVDPVDVGLMLAGAPASNGQNAER